MLDKLIKKYIDLVPDDENGDYFCDVEFSRQTSINEWVIAKRNSVNLINQIKSSKSIELNDSF